MMRAQCSSQGCDGYHAPLIVAENDIRSVLHWSSRQLRWLEQSGEDVAGLAKECTPHPHFAAQLPLL